MITINLNKASEITKQALRSWREVEFKYNDIQIQNALIDGDEEAKAEAIAYRDFLRDLPSECDNMSIIQLKDLMDALNG